MGGILGVHHTENGLARALPQPGVHAFVPALAGDPLKAVRVVLAVVEGGLGGIQAAQLGKIFLEAVVEGILHQAPVQLLFSHPTPGNAPAHCP